MKIRTLHPRSYGRFDTETPLELSPGLNIITGPNEAGKSTLASFIKGMFYGHKKEGRTRIQREPEFERYRPWMQGSYKGSLTYEEGGRTWRVERSFDPDYVRIYDDQTGEDVTSLFAQDSRKEFDFAERHLGLGPREFRNTVWIGQLGSPQEAGLGAQMQAKMEAALQGGDVDVPLARALALLGNEKTKLKGPRTTRARIDLLNDELSATTAELLIAQSRDEEIRAWAVELCQLEAESAEAQESVAQVEATIRAFRRAMLQDILAQVNEIDRASADAAGRAEKHAWSQDLPEDAHEQFVRLCGEREILERAIQSQNEERARLHGRREDIERRLADVSGTVPQGLTGADLSTLYSQYISAKAATAKAERAANEARSGLRRAEQAWRQSPYSERRFPKDALARADELEGTVRIAEKAQSQMEVEVERARLPLVSSTGRSSPIFYSLALGSLGIAIVLTVLGSPSSSLPAFGIAVALFVTGGLRQRAASRQKEADRKALAAKEEDLVRQAGLIAEALDALAQYLQSMGAGSIQELRSRVRDCEQLEARLQSAREGYELGHTDWFQASAEYSRLEREMLSLLGGDTVTDAAVLSLRKRLEDIAELGAALTETTHHVAGGDSALGEKESRLREHEQKEEEFLAQCGVASGDELRQKLAAEKELLLAQTELADLLGKRTALLGGRDVGYLQAELSSLQEELETHHIADSDAVIEGAPKDIEDARRELDDRRAKAALIHSRMAALRQGIQLRSREGRPSAEIIEDHSRLEDYLQVLLEERDALELAENTLGELSRNLRREYAPALNARVGQILREVTGGKYSEVRVSPDLEMSVVHPESGNQVALSSLSGGTADQCYFALRVAVAEVASGRRDFPLFLDDSFVQYDEVRLGGVLGILGRLSQDHQILLFTCHPREEATARALGIPHHRIEL